MPPATPPPATEHREELGRQAGARLSEVLAAGGGERLDAAVQHLPAIVRSRETSNTRKVIMLNKVADEISSIVAPHTICRRSCSHCCHQHVMISELEARLIEQGTGRKRAAVERVPVQDVPKITHEKQKRYTGVPCSFLGAEGECTIYEHRPLKCRTHFSLADSAHWCDTGRGLTVRDLPLYENEPLLYAYVAVTMYTTLGDIREFFPR